jgi:hypothetical protein
MIGRENANIGRDGNITSNIQAAAIIQPATLVDRGMAAQPEMSSGIKLSPHENKSSVPDVEAHNRTVKPAPDEVAGKMRHHPIA